MKETVATVETKNGSRYIAQLCKHFGHKAEARYDEASGDVDFGFGRCELRAEPDRLTLRGVAQDDAGLARLEEVVGGHLERFAWKETPAINWSRG